MSTHDLDLPPIERAVLYTPRPGDKLIIEIPSGQVTEAQVEQIRIAAEDELGCEVVVFVGARVGGVVRSGRQ